MTYDFSLPANHSHSCPKCAREWAHSVSSLNSAPAHTCPSCGAIEFVVHNFASPRAEVAFLEAKVDSIMQEYPNAEEVPTLILIDVTICLARIIFLRKTHQLED